MPFTLSHAAAALPFRRSRLVPSAVVIGCFAPDLTYFFQIGPQRLGGFAHRLPGLFLLDLPFAFCVLWLFHHAAKVPLAEALPATVRRRLEVGPRSLSIDSLSRFMLIVVSILLGAVTHILWDWFTHPRYWLYQHWEFLRRVVRVPVIGPLQYCNVFQYISSVIGVLIIVIWCIHWYRTSPVIHPNVDLHASSVSRIVLTSAFVIAVLWGFIHAVITGIPHGIHGSQRFATESVVTAITVFCLEVIIYGLIQNRIAPSETS